MGYQIKDDRVLTDEEANNEAAAELFVEQGGVCLLICAACFFGYTLGGMLGLGIGLVIAIVIARIESVRNVLNGIWQIALGCAVLYGLYKLVIFIVEALDLRWM